MWFSFWRSRDRFSLDELRYLTDQLQKVQIVNQVNKDFVVEALRSIAELLTYGDQHDSSFFEFFMERQIMGEFVRILKVSKTAAVSLQLLQTMSIMIQNLKSEHAIYYMFSNEHVNFLITYSFDFRNEELLSYYISFLRAISGKLNTNTISLLVKTQNDAVFSFPLYVEAIKFAFHEESMIRTAVRTVTLNIYHVGDDSVNRYITSGRRSCYFSDLVIFFKNLCIDLNRVVSEGQRKPGPDLVPTILAAVDEIEDNLYYLSDVVSAGIPDVGRLITDNMLQLLILPVLFPSLWVDIADMQNGAASSLYLLCCILRTVKIKDLANMIAAALFCLPEAFVLKPKAEENGCVSGHGSTGEKVEAGIDNFVEMDAEQSRVIVPKKVSPCQVHSEGVLIQNNCGNSCLTLRETLLSYITAGTDVQALGSLSVLSTLLQTKELDESMLDALGVLPQRKQHKKLLLQALVGEDSGEGQLFSSEIGPTRDGISGELEGYLHKLKEQYGMSCPSVEAETRPLVHRNQVLDALVSLFCRSNISAETLWDGGWLLRQLLPYSETEFKRHHLELLKDSYRDCASGILQETRGVWPDLLITVLCDQWKKCKRAIEASSPWKEPKHLLLPNERSTPECMLDIPTESSFVAGERMYEVVKVFVLHHQVQIFSLGRALPEQAPVHPPVNVPQNSRATKAGLDGSGPKSGTEIRLVDALPCRIAFERGKERHFCFLAVSLGILGWVVLAEELPLKQQYGIVRVAAPLSGSNPRIDEKHSRWLHLRIRPSSLPLVDPSNSEMHAKVKIKSLVDGRWTLAFRDDSSCRRALSMILEEITLQSKEVERRLKPVVDLESTKEISDT